MSVTRLMVGLTAAVLVGLAVPTTASAHGLQAGDATAPAISRTALLSADSAHHPMADSPSPTLGSTPQPGVNPPGDNDGDAADFSQVWLGVLAPLTIVVLVGGSIAFYLIRRSRRSRPANRS